MVKLEELVAINKRFAEGKVRNQSSLDYALTQVEATEDWHKQLALLLRAIIADQAFESGNKSTAAYLVVKFSDERKMVINVQKVYNLVINVAEKKIGDVEKLRRMIKSALA